VGVAVLGTVVLVAVALHEPTGAPVATPPPARAAPPDEARPAVVRSDPDPSHEPVPPREPFTAAPIVEPQSPHPTCAPSEQRVRNLRFVALRLGMREDELARLVSAEEVGKQFDEVCAGCLAELSRACTARDEQVGIVYKQKLARGDFTTQPKHEPIPAARDGELVRTGVFWDPVIRSDVRRVVRIWACQFPDLHKALRDHEAADRGVTSILSEFVRDLSR
jgi:hypothetical protein